MKSYFIDDPEGQIIHNFKRLSSVHQTAELKQLFRLVGILMDCYEQHQGNIERKTTDKESKEVIELRTIRKHLKEFYLAFTYANEPQKNQLWKEEVHFYLTLLKKHPFVAPKKVVTVRWE